MADIHVLRRPMYVIPEAARLLELSSTTLKRWLEGSWRKGVFYEPIIRPEPLGTDEVTWGEFVEAGYLREYRKQRVTLQHLRGFVDRLRHDFDVPYPLATERPYVGEGRRLVQDVQRELGLPATLYAVVDSGDNQQLVLAPPAEAFFNSVEFNPDTRNVYRLRPAGPDSPVRIDPDLSFGIPQVKGIRTEVLYDARANGEDLEVIAESWELALSEVVAAIDFEQRLRVRPRSVA